MLKYERTLERDTVTGKIYECIMTGELLSDDDLVSLFNKYNKTVMEVYYEHFNSFDKNKNNSISKDDPIIISGIKMIQEAEEMRETLKYYYNLRNLCRIYKNDFVYYHFDDLERKLQMISEQVSLWIDVPFYEIRYNVDFNQIIRMEQQLLEKEILIREIERRTYSSMD